jgi:hypothetical protein
LAPAQWRAIQPQDSDHHWLQSLWWEGGRFTGILWEMDIFVLGWWKWTSDDSDPSPWLALITLEGCFCSPLTCPILSLLKIQMAWFHSEGRSGLSEPNNSFETGHKVTVSSGVWRFSKRNKFLHGTTQWFSCL